jgi:hypothetical protein
LVGTHVDVVVAEQLAGADGFSDGLDLHVSLLLFFLGTRIKMGSRRGSRG